MGIYRQVDDDTTVKLPNGPEEIPAWPLEQRIIEMSYGFVGEDEAGQDGKAGNPVGLSMEPDAASRSRSQKTCGISNLSCSNPKGLVIAARR